MSHVLFCKSLNDFHSDCSLCSRVVIKDIHLKNCILHNFSNIRPLNLNTVVKNLFVDEEIDCYNYDVIFPSARFEKIVKQAQNCCLLFESCNSPADFINFFTQTMLRFYFNSLRDIFADFGDSYSLSVFYQEKFSSINICSAAIALELHILLYESLFPLKYYDSTCFKTVNKNYLNYIIAAKK